MVSRCQQKGVEFGPDLNRPVSRSAAGWKPRVPAEYRLSGSAPDLGYTHRPRTTWARTRYRRFLPRRGLAVRTPPRGWRRTERLLECTGESGFGFVADNG